MVKRKQGPVRCATYSRCSSDDQRHGDFTTVDAQREINTRYVAEKGAVLVKAYSDEGKTGTNLKRAGWKALVADAQVGLFDVVVVTYMSRLARGAKYYVAEYMLDECGVTIERASQHYTDDMMGHMNKEMTIFLDGMYPKQVSQWTRTKMGAMVEKGYFCGGTVPFGYRKEPVPGAAFTSSSKEPPKRLVPDADQAEIVRHAFNLYLEKRTLAAVRSYLLTVTDRKWVTTIVKNLLMNEVYLGVLAFGEWRKDDAHEPIVEKETFEQVQQALGQFSPRAASGDDDFAYYLRGRVRCPHCGCPYTHLSVNRSSAKRPKNRIHYYVCSKANKGKSECPVVRVNAEALHHTVLFEMERAVQHHTVMHRHIAATGGWGNADVAQKTVRGQLAKKKQFNAVQISNLVNAVAQGGNSRSLVTTLERLEAEQDELIRQLAVIETEIAQATVKRPTAVQVQRVWGETLGNWKDFSEQERTDALGALVQEVVVTEKDRVHLQFTQFAEVHGQMLALTSQMGAGTGNTYTFINPRCQRVTLFVPSGGKCRVKIPRSERQDPLTETL